MHRVNHLFDQIRQCENLRQAFYKAARGRRYQFKVREFSDQLDLRIKALAEQLSDGSIRLGRFHQFIIRDPKERVITAPDFEERVLHHAIMNILEPILDRWLIHDTYACRRGKGREAAVLKARVYSRRTRWYLKFDVRKYFDSIHHGRILELLERRIKDYRVLNLLAHILKSYRGELGVGIPIGSLTSQHFANFYLGWFDRFVKEQLGIHHYVRYMDDMVLWHCDREYLKVCHKRCLDFVSSELLLSMKPSQVHRTEEGMKFLGCKVFPTHVTLNGRSKKRYRCRYRFLTLAHNLGLITNDELQHRLSSLNAFATAATARSWKMRRSVLASTLGERPK
jgi:retron-type reverse transcriptase